MLEGPKEGLADLAWHPNRPIVASVTMSGLICLWARDYTESWSAFAPDFRVLHENEEYVEREDEFDMERPDCDKASAVREEVIEEVDIMTTEKVAAYSDSDDSDDRLDFLPTTPLRGDAVDGPVKQPSSSHPNGRSPSEQEVGQNGRTRRKRKSPEEADDFQQETINLPTKVLSVTVKVKGVTGTRAACFWKPAGASKTAGSPRQAGAFNPAPAGLPKPSAPGLPRPAAAGLSKPATTSKPASRLQGSRHRGNGMIEGHRQPQHKAPLCL